ncbi:MAG: hypothetical protein IJA71_04520, partial [Clostridia bacterium]|nr:hypothetical protein [Clostridia bacterium]
MIEFFPIIYLFIPKRKCFGIINLYLIGRNCYIFTENLLRFLRRPHKKIPAAVAGICWKVFAESLFPQPKGLFHQPTQGWSKRFYGKATRLRAKEFTSP